MSVSFTVDLDQLAESIADLTTLQGRCEDALDLVRRRVEELHGTWSGQAARAHRECQDRWEADFALMQEALQQMRTSAQTAERRYRRAIETNVAMWSL